MSNRFNSNFNKPQRVNLISKQRVMADFKGIQENMTAIRQGHVQPGPDPPIPEYLREHADRLALNNKVEKAVAETSNGGATTAYRTISQGNSTMKHNGFVRLDPEKRELIPCALKESLMRHRNTLDVNLWDAKHFSSMNPKLPIYSKRTAFIDFSSQMNRPPMRGSTCNEARFNTLDHFPANSLSRVKHEP